MVKRGDKISNPWTGQTMHFLKTGKETNGKLLEIECYNPKSDAREPVHVHPKQESSNTVLSGQLHFLINGKEHIIGPGNRIDIPRGVSHCFWNEDDMPAHHIAQFSPALTIADFFKSYFELCADGKTNEKGMPNFFQVCLSMLKHKNDIRLTSPPWPLQLLTYTILSPVGFIMGYRPTYTSTQKSNSIPSGKGRALTATKDH